MSSEGKFKVGDRVVWVTYGQRGIVTGLFRHIRVTFDVQNPEDTSSGSILPENLELEKIYDSPLYKALK